MNIVQLMRGKGLVFVLMGLFFLATQNMVHAYDEPEPEPDKPASGDIVFPDDYQGKEKKCLTVCEKWGQDCILNPRTGSRKCRRVCKQFGEECFTDL